MKMIKDININAKYTYLSFQEVIKLIDPKEKIHKVFNAFFYTA
jgi:hypothetical protein